MADERKFANAESLRSVARAAFGAGRCLLRVERLGGGSKKGVYRLTMGDGGTALVYAWDDSEDYWQGVLPEGADDPADPFSDRSRALYPADIAVVEDVTGGSLEALWTRIP